MERVADVIRGILCRHRWVFLRNIQTGDGMWSLWYCPRCGRIRCKREPWSWDDR